MISEYHLRLNEPHVKICSTSPRPAFGRVRFSWVEFSQEQGTAFDLDFLSKNVTDSGHRST